MEPVIKTLGYRHSHMFFFYRRVLLLPAFVAGNNFHNPAVREPNLNILSCLFV